MSDKKVSWDQFKQRFQWKRRMEPKEVKTLASEIFGNVLNGETYDDNYPYARLADFINSILRRSGTTYKTFKGFFQAQLKNHPLITKTIYYKPINVDEVDKDKFKANIDVPLYKNTMKSEVFISSKEPDNSELFAKISNLDDKEPSVEEPGEEPQPNEDVPKEDEKKKTSSTKKSNPERPKLTKEQKDIMKAQTIANMFKGPSWADQYKEKITAIAKDKSLMSLSKEQFQDYLKEKLHVDDKNLDAVTEAVVTRRAELLANKQLNREQLTDFDVEKLQEQSQRDFERKLHDQNLRYILPAMLDKRDRLVVNRLNPELLKCGY